MESFELKLKNEDGKLHAIQCLYDKSSRRSCGPRLKVVHYIVRMTLYTQHGVIPNAVLKSLSRFWASEIEQVTDGLRGIDLTNLPGKVRQIGTDEEYFFRPADDGQRCLREIEMQSRIEKGPKNLKMVEPNNVAVIRTPRLLGLVMWDKEDED